MTCHPGLKVFIHNTKNAAQSIQEDPSDPEKPNPNKTRAMESSLWETKTLENHVLPLVAQACTFIEKPAFPNIEFDLDEVIGQDYDDVRSLSCPSKFCNFILQNYNPKYTQFHAKNDYFQLFEEEVGKKKNNDQLDGTKSSPPCDFEFSSSLRSLSDSIHSAGSTPKRIQT